MTQYTFSQLDEWSRATQARMDAIVKGSTQEICRIAQTPVTKGGRLPFDLGNLMNSFQSSLNGGTALEGAASYVAIAASMEAGDVAEFGWGAEYARRLEYGFTGQDSLGRTYNQQGRHFLSGAMLEWPTVVAEQVAKAKAAVARNAG